jgi:hypothetical protein
MQPPDVLLSIGEVAIAYVGFSSIVAVFSAERRGGWLSEDRVIFRAMIELSLVSIFASFLPHALETRP